MPLNIDRSLRFGHDGEDRPSALITAGNKALASLRDNEGRISQVLGIVNAAILQIVKTASYRGDGQARSFTYTLAGQLKTVSVNGALITTSTYNRRACAEFCEKAECDPDKKDIWGGSIEKCIRGCLPAKCGGNGVGIS